MVDILNIIRGTIHSSKFLEVKG